MNYIGYALLSAFFASLVPIFGKLGLKNTSPEVGSAIRALIMTIFLFAVSVGRKNITTPPTRELIFLTLSGLAGALSWFFYFKAIKLGKVSIVAPIDRMSVALAVLLAWIFLGEEITVRSVIGVLLIITGVILLI
ncbi:EamA family transporter [Pyrococcus sp. ST04]|uniref:EamA family transporter n=1 Tax=Pyrococcus sp. ST04 TaxID=1183377 RepID=UPI0002605EC7|nr:EamA family transporter [Pyrococcus sp. ST04]AFK22627.1 putative permease [Pyrococcus sp. ST04]